LVGRISRGWEFRFVQIKRAGPLKGHLIRRKMGNFDKPLKIFLFMNHWPVCINIWHGSSLRQGDSDSSDKSLGSQMTTP